MINRPYKSQVLPAFLALAIYGVAAVPGIRGDETETTDVAPQMPGVAASDNAQDTDTKKNISFCRQVAPLLFERCVACHGERDFQSDYSLFSYDLSLKAGSSGADPIVPGSVGESYLFDLVSADDPGFWMPHEKPRLADEEIQLLRDWIESGATFDGEDSTTALWQIIPPTVYPSPDAESVSLPITAVAFSPDGQQLAFSGLHEISIVSSASGEFVCRIQNVAERTYDLVFHTEPGQIIAASGTPGGLGEVRIYDVATGELVRELVRFQGAALGLAIDPAGTRLACCGADRTIRIYNIASGEEELVAQHHSDWVYHVAFSPDGKRIVSASRDMTAKVIDSTTGDLVTTYNAHRAPVRDAAFLPSGEQAISCGNDHKIHVWTTAATGKASAMSETPQDEKKVAEIAGFGHDVLRLAVTGDSLFGASADARVHQYHFRTRHHQRVFAAHRYPVYALAVHSGSNRLATGCHDGQVKIWNIETGELEAEWQADEIRL